MILPIKSVFRKQKLSDILYSQVSRKAELGVELVEETSYIENRSNRIYCVYTKLPGEDWSRDAFVITRHIVNGRIKEDCLEGDIYFR